MARLFGIAVTNSSKLRRNASLQTSTPAIPTTPKKIVAMTKVLNPKALRLHASAIAFMPLSDWSVSAA